MKLILNWYFPKERELTEWDIDVDMEGYENWLHSMVNQNTDVIFFYTTPSTDIFDDPQQMVIIKRQDMDSWSGPPPVFCAVAESEEAAKRWIQDEVDGKHNSGHGYMQGKDADWWIKYGTFTLTPVDIQR